MFIRFIYLIGWYDIFQGSTLEAFHIYKQQNPLTFLFMNPYGHCSPKESQVDYPRNTEHLKVTSCFYFFKTIDNEHSYTSKLNTTTSSSAPLLHTPTASYKSITLYVMGPSYISYGSKKGNYWVTMDDFLPTNIVPLYLQHDATLNLNKSSISGSFDYLYNSSNPMPTIGGPNFANCGPWDQSALEKSRSDQLIFTSQAFPQEFALLGKLKAKLFVSSNATDTDFVVKITDVYPDGKSMLLYDGVQRMRWRDTRTEPHLMVPGQVYEIEVDCWSIAYILNTEHRLRVTITSSNYPRYDVNPNNGLPLTEKGPLLNAKNSVYFGDERASRVEFPFVDINALYAAKIA